jgi:hypothetical protein
MELMNADLFVIVRGTVVSYPDKYPRLKEEAVFEYRV